MQVSRFGQGLATSAVSALMISGLALTTPAYAVDTAGVRLLSQQDGIASVKQDSDAFFSSGRTVTLAAEQLDPATTVTFEYNRDPAADDDADGWTSVELPVLTSTRPEPQATATDSIPTGRYVSTTWSPGADLVGTRLAIRAVATTPAQGETPATATYSRRNDVLMSSDAEAVSLGSDDPFTLYNRPGPYFEQPYTDSGRTASLLAVSGTTSATDGTVELSIWNPAIAAFVGRVDAAVSPRSLKVSSGGIETPGVSVAGGEFSTVLDIAGYDLGDGDSVALRAERVSDDVVPVLLDQQHITSIQAFAPSVGEPDDNQVDVQVLDESSRAVAGAEVRRASDGSIVGYTDAYGWVTAPQASGTTESYYANTTDVDAFEDGTDVTTGDVTIPDYVPVATATVAELADGVVFDDQEYADGDIALQVVDGRGDPFAGVTEITYSLGVPGAAPSDPVTATTDEDGRFTVPFDPADEDGEYTLGFTAPSSAGGEEEEPVTFVAGDAVLALSPLTGTAASGGHITYDGVLTVGGEPLAHRDIDLAYTRGVEQAPGTSADASLLLDEGRALTGRATTDEDGVFVVTVADDVETGGPAETGGVLEVVAHGLGDAIRATADFTAGVVPPTAPTTPAPTPTPTPTPGKGRIDLTLKGSDARDGADRLRVRGPEAASGLRVRIHALTPGGFWRVLKGVDLDGSGDAALTVTDPNGDKATRYRVRLVPNARFKAMTSKVLRLR